MGFILLLALLGTAYGDYDCLCNYSIEKSVYNQPSVTSHEIGYMYEFDCKPTVHMQNESNVWAAIVYEHQLGYVVKDADGIVQICQGAISPADKLTSPQPRTHATEFTVPFTKTTLKTKQTLSASAQTLITTPTTLAPTSSNTRKTSNATTPFTSTKGTKTTAPSMTTQTTEPTTDAKRMCPTNLLQVATADDGIIIVDKQRMKCFELVELHTSWSRAVDHCKRNGGQLATIKNLQQNELLHTYVLSQYQHRTWIGMSERGGRVTWVSGDPVSYTNWNGDKMDTSNGPCILMEPVSGMWEGGNCIYSYPYICEFDISPHAASTLVG